MNEISQFFWNNISFTNKDTKLQDEIIFIIISCSTKYFSQFFVTFLFWNFKKSRAKFDIIRATPPKSIKIRHDFRFRIVCFILGIQIRT